MDEAQKKVLDMQIFVPSSSSNQEQDYGLYINCSHLLSATYMAEIRGELLPIYKFVQQMEMGPNLRPLTSKFKQEICLAKGNGYYIDIDDMNEENTNWATAHVATKERMKGRVEEFLRES
ncbi:hypothetical protein JCGZ_22193 [Jatropha curcas]|uniref:Uncharacterized protein n=1 Tax=Jatropha curcas TaxID=180498 RepID=A0A067JVX9_JATCU|nr:hypothetical protein JCGZ_22193 [Jatropha curcas]